MNTEKSCGALVIRKKLGDNQILLVHQNAGHWSFPKGHVESGETEHQTAVREVREETGIEIEILGDFRQIVRFSPKKNVMKDVVYFMAKQKSGSLARQESEISELAWVNLDEAESILTYDNDRELLKMALPEINEVLK